VIVPSTTSPKEKKAICRSLSLSALASVRVAASLI
jgi:hypothetical protein